MASYSLNRPCPNCDKTGTMPAQCKNCGTEGCDFCVGMPPSTLNDTWETNCAICNKETEIMSLP